MVGAAVWRTRDIGERARAALGRRRDALAVLLRPGPPPRPSRWAWTADAVLALILAVCTVSGAMDMGQDGPARPIGPIGPIGVLGGGAEVAVPPPPSAPALPALPAPPALPPPGPIPYPGAAELALAALTAMPLVVRRRYPLAAFWAVLALTLVFRLGHGGESVPDTTSVYTFLSCVVAAYSAAVHSPHRRRALGSLLAGAVLMAVFHDEYFPYFTPGFVPFLVLLAVGLGANAIHTWQQRVRDLQARQESATRLAVERERARIARELHDVVTHNVSVMVIQAGAARKVMDTAPDLAREALLAVEAGGRTALTELRHVMGLLTMAAAEPASSPAPDPDPRPAGAPGGPDPAADLTLGPDLDLAPQPGLAQLTALTDRVRAAGTPVDLTVTGSPAPLPQGAELAAYRVVQEALTNVVKHAVGARVRVTVAHTEAAVRIEVADTGGTPAAPAGPAGGRGLLGLRERLAVYDGTLEAAPWPTGGFRVRATIPLGAP
ncbi:sensor histidine kinase [Streptomyces sp. NPDC056716]|uniref:sensor histidine kinase n=1 Tax=unclassified Streptomyces TaxID=2593676 RepID=UPI0036C73C84